MNTLWVVLGLGAAASVVALLSAWRKGSHAEDMGAVSHQWIAEHRLGANQDSRR